MTRADLHPAPRPLASVDPRPGSFPIRGTTRDATPAPSPGCAVRKNASPSRRGSRFGGILAGGMASAWDGGAAGAPSPPPDFEEVNVANRGRRKTDKTGGGFYDRIIPSQATRTACSKCGIPSPLIGADGACLKCRLQERMAS